MSVQSPPAARTEAPAPVQKIEPAEKWRRLLMAPSVVPLLLWMVVPLGLTIYFSFIHYSLESPAGNFGFVGLQNYQFLWGDYRFPTAILNTIIFLVSVLVITVVVGVLLAVLYDQDFPGKNIAMLLVIAPFFVMPTVTAQIWDRLFMDPIYGVIASSPIHCSRSLLWSLGNGSRFLS
jgi:sorbitol/mannitol transport system permease protein